MPYYSNGGPGPATKLLRVDSPADASFEVWRFAPAFRWTPRAGWKPDDHAQLDILQTGDYFMVDASQVEAIQQQMSAPTQAFY